MFRRQISASLGAADWVSAKMSSILELNRVIVSTLLPSGAHTVDTPKETTRGGQQIFRSRTLADGPSQQRSHESYLQLLVELPSEITLKLDYTTPALYIP